MAEFLKVPRKELDIRNTLQCGQVFRFTDSGDGSFILYSKDKAVTLKEDEDHSYICPSDPKDLSYWENYFDLGLSYEDVLSQICWKDKIISSIHDKFSGIRILRQDPYETVISFIISQNNNIPRIKKIINTLCENYGERHESSFGTYFGFPKRESLLSASQKDFSDMGFGYRSGYVYNTLRMLDDSFILKLISLEYKEAFEKLLSLDGVGPKVANCISLFGLHKLNAFPVDTWIKKVLHTLYNVDNSNDINAMTCNYGEYGGIAQQYLFHYARLNQELFR